MNVTPLLRSKLGTNPSKRGRDRSVNEQVAWWGIRAPVAFLRKVGEAQKMPTQIDTKNSHRMKPPPPSLASFTYSPFYLSLLFTFSKSSFYEFLFLFSIQGRQKGQVREKKISVTPKWRSLASPDRLFHGEAKNMSLFICNNSLKIKDPSFCPLL